MAITIRPYRGREDLEEEIELARRATLTLPWASKLTRARFLSVDTPTFDPRSRVYAHEGNELIGFAGFLGYRGLIEMEYPWVLPGYEGAVQEKLLDRVEEFARSDESGARLSRLSLRRQWIRQIELFLRNDYRVVGENLMFLISTLGPLSYRGSQTQQVVEVDQFDIEYFSRTSPMWEADSSIESTYQQIVLSTMDFDFVLRIEADGKNKSQCGVTIRADTGFAEVRFLSAETDPEDHVLPLLEHTRKLLYGRGIGHFGIPETALLRSLGSLDELGYQTISADLILEKSYSH